MSMPRETLSQRVERLFHRESRQRSIDLHSAAHALEDLPAEARVQGAEILSTPAGADLQRHVFDVVENGALDVYGHLELLRVLSFLCRYPVTAYTYGVSPTVGRGERPNAAKLTSLVQQGYGATLNLCAEIPDGDRPLIVQAGLSGHLVGYRSPIVDMTPPTVEQMVSILDLLSDLGSRGIRTYVHCEAGMARTGVVIACYRMAVMGWDVTDALTEARNFGCSVPAQQAFIESFGVHLKEQFAVRNTDGAPAIAALGRYPLLEPGSVAATPRQLATTLRSVARSERGLAE